MPELPEVETIRLQLSLYLPFEITAITWGAHGKSLIRQTEFILSAQHVVSEMDRHGKVLIFKLAQGELHSQLGMSGGWIVSTTPPTLKHTHLTLICCAQGESKQHSFYLSYHDPRRFGKMFFVTHRENSLALKNTGLDISHAVFTLDQFNTSLKRYPERVLKVTLLDQKLFSGVGNYMASEICAHARVRPTRRVKTLSQKEITALYQALKLVVDQSISTGGTTFSGGYRDTTGEKGEGVKNLVVFYQEICQLCHKTPVKKVFLATRGTYYCPTCQN